MAPSIKRLINAVVVSAGLMTKTVKVRISRQEWDSHIKKHFNRTKFLLVHDPASSARVGDVIAIEAGWRKSRNIRHVVSSIVAPFGTPIEERPPVPTEAERLAEKRRKRAEKEGRQATITKEEN